VKNAVKAMVAILLTASLSVQYVHAIGAACVPKFVNPITDICWNCIFPMTIGSVPIAPSAYPDTENPSMPISFCPKPPPIFMQIGLNIGYWEPYALVDITRVPYCMVSLGMELSSVNPSTMGGKTSASDSVLNSAFFQAHWYKYPVIYWLQILQSAACMSTDAFDIAYLTEIDPLWNDDELSFVINPEAILFGSPIAQLACVPEAILTTSNTALPLDPLFWCLGSQGGSYPLTGHTNHMDTPTTAAVLIMERLNYKLHRQGIVLETRGVEGAICYQWPEPILPKSRYRYQMTGPIPDAAWCHPYGTTSTIWEAGHDNPVTGENFGFVNFRKRNCVFL
jgi:conjugal transfer pilus assembly protein TraU